MKQKLEIIGLVLVCLVVLASFASALTIKSVDSNPKEIAPGESAKVKLTLENEFEEDLEYVAISLDLTYVPFAPYKSGADKIIEKLDEGDEEDITFELIALTDSEAGTYKIPVVMTYSPNNQTAPIVKTSFIGLTINAEPNLQLSYQGDLIKGSKNQLKIEITNIGLTEVKFLNVQVADTSGIRILSSDKVYIGDIESDDFDNAEFDIFIEEDAGSLITIPILMTYRDSANNLESETINLEVIVYTKDEAIELGIIKKSNAAIYLGVIVVLIVVYILYRNAKKYLRKKKNK